MSTIKKLKKKTIFHLSCDCYGNPTRKKQLMKLNQLEWIDDNNVCQYGTPSTNSTMSIRCHENYKVGVEGHESALMTHEKMQSSHHHTCTLPTMHAHSEESGSPYDTKVVYKCNAIPPKTKKPNFALPISGTAKLNL